ncbi:hypothetical protein CRG98_005304 [Punica granatum]|uniref:Phenazine biosynthesis-like domain-containing protein n=1 Tax=Punica granatum TaxID=22663 RepID=A0A2I0L0S6_PUNGR|nr:hypothetical protein CRG98_005304 [Punica granatum]
MKMTAADDLLVVFSSAEEVENFQPQFDEIEKCPGRGLLITAAAPPDSSFDFYSRFFCPKLGIYEASPRGGVLHLQLDKRNQRMLLRGKAVTVMEGSLLV